MPWPPEPEKRISKRDALPFVSAMVGLLCLLPHASERGDELGALAVMQQAHGVLLAQARDALLELAGWHGVLLLAAQELRGIGGQVEAPVVHGARGHRLDRGEPRGPPVPAPARGRARRRTRHARCDAAGPRGTARAGARRPPRTCWPARRAPSGRAGTPRDRRSGCLLYTSDAADE